jgi:Rod binding domain-containing protein
MSIQPMMSVPSATFSLNKATTQEDKIKAAHDFEEMFLKFVFKSIMPKDTEGGLFGTSHSAEMYRSLWIDATAKEAAKRGVGIARQVLKSIDQKDKESESIQKGGFHDQYA